MNREGFLREAFLELAVRYALARSSTYREEAKDNDREKFRTALREHLKGLSGGYSNAVDHERHIRNIERLARDLSEEFPSILRNRRFKIGPAQKAFNLYLKYLWCANLIHYEPPHCPFDSFIIAKLPGCKNIKWSKIDTVEEYGLLVESARTEGMAESPPLSIARWELKNYNPDERRI